MEREQREGRAGAQQQTGGTVNRQTQQQNQLQKEQQKEQQNQQQNQQQRSGSGPDEERQIPSTSETAPVRVNESQEVSRGSRIATPWELMRRMSAELDRLARDQGMGVDWIPQVELAQRKDAVVVRVELAGVAPDEVEVTIDNGILTVSGQRQQERREEQDGIVRTERSYGRFARTVPLPDGTDESRATAEFRNGVLEVTVPLSGRGRGRRITVESDSAKSDSARTGA
jgi:HSP20 family protein